MLKSIQVLSHGDCLNVSTRCTLVTTRPSWRISSYGSEQHTWFYLSDLVWFLEILIVEWVNTSYGQSPAIREQVDSHRVGCVNWLDREMSTSRI